GSSGCCDSGTGTCFFRGNACSNGQVCNGTVCAARSATNPCPNGCCDTASSTCVDYTACPNNGCCDYSGGGGVCAAGTSNTVCGSNASTSGTCQDCVGGFLGTHGHVCINHACGCNSIADCPSGRTCDTQ